MQMGPPASSRSLPEYVDTLQKAVVAAAVRSDPQFAISIFDGSSRILRVAVRSLKTEAHRLSVWQQHDTVGTG
jgi:hypothetical protein